jgi:glycosyltransferase involved in cell wall biosynthesis
MSTLLAEPVSVSRIDAYGRGLRVYMMDLLSNVPYYTGHLSAALGRLEGLRVTLGSITYSYDPAFFRKHGLRNDPGVLDFTYRLPKLPASVRRGAKLAESLVNLAAVAARFRTSRPDVLHVQFAPLVNHGLPFEIWLFRLARRLGIKIVYTVHNVLPQDTGERYRRTYEHIYRRADRLICHDQAAAARLVGEFAVAPERISVIPHGPLFHPAGEISPTTARRRLGFREGECVVLWQGILRPYKGVSFLLDAWRQVANHKPGARLAIVGVGDDDQVHAVKRQVSELGLRDQVRLELRFVSLDELTDYYSAADILVYPYSEITTSGALMTGIGYGKAIVASTLPAFERILRDGENALLAPYGNVDALAERLSRLIGNPDLRQRLAGRLNASQSAVTGWTDIAAQTRDCYAAAVSA